MSDKIQSKSLFYNGSYYFVTSGVNNQMESANIAAGLGGSLAKVTSSAENSAVLEFLQSMTTEGVASDGGGAKYVWLGLNDSASEGNFVWMNGASNQGEALGSYNAWGSSSRGSEPDDFFGQDGVGIAMTDWPLGVVGQWNDIDISNLLMGLIELDASSVRNLNVSIEFMGSDNNDALSGTAANDVIDGKNGNDTLTVSNNRAQYSLSDNGDGSISLSGMDIGTDQLKNIEKIQFSDSAYNLEIATKAASISKADLNSLIDLYVAYFNRVPEASGLSYWIDQFKGGKTVDQIAKEFYDAGVQFSEVTGYTADMSNGDFIRKAYANVLGRSGDKAPPQADVAYWDNQITSGAVTKEGMIKSMLAGARTFANDPEWGWVTKLLDNKVELGRLHAVTYGLDYNDTKTSIDKTVEYASKVTADGIDTAVNLIGLSQDDYIA